MLSKIFEKLNNFSIQFTIFLVILGIIIYSIIGMLAKNPNPNIEIKYFNIVLFIIVILIISNIGFSFYAIGQTTNKKGPSGSMGIEGTRGKKGDNGMCDELCGSKVCYIDIKKAANKTLNKNLKLKKGYLQQQAQEQNYSASIIYTNTSKKVVQHNLLYSTDYTTSELNGSNKEIKAIEVYPDYEIYVKKDKKSIKLKEGIYDILELSKLGIEADDISNGKIKSIKINTFVNNVFLLNKINVLCNSENYQQLLRKNKGKLKINEVKLIKYMSDTISTWITDLVNFEISVKQKDKEAVVLYPGIRFLREKNFTLEMLKDYKQSRKDCESPECPVNSPFTTYTIGYNDEIISNDGEIMKYDLWRWGEEYTTSPMIVKKCLKKSNLPQGLGPKLFIIKTNSYEPVYTSEINPDLYSMDNCPYNQILDDDGHPTNPRNISSCVKLGTFDNIQWKKNVSPVWKTKQIKDFSQGISLYNPRFNNGCYWFKDPVTNIYYYPVGSVWRGTKNVKAPESKIYYPKMGNSCSLINKKGPQKETILVSGDIALPIDYRLIWNSNEMGNKDGDHVILKVGAYVFVGSNQTGEKIPIKQGNYNKNNISFTDKAPKSLLVKENFKLVVNRNVLGVSEQQVFESNISLAKQNTNIDIFDVPKSCQFQLDAVTVQKDGKGKFVPLNAGEIETFPGAIPCYGIRSDTKVGDNILYRYLTSDEIYGSTSFKNGNPAVAYFPVKYNIEKQRILQGYTSEIYGGDSNTENVSTINSSKYPPSKDQGILLFTEENFTGDYIWIGSGQYLEEQLMSLNMYKNVKSMIIYPGYKAELVGQSINVTHSQSTYDDINYNNYWWWDDWWWGWDWWWGDNWWWNTSYVANTYTEDKTIKITCQSGCYPKLANGKLNNLMAMNIERTTDARIWFSGFAFWTFIKHPSKTGVYYIKNPWVPSLYLSTDSVTSNIFSMRNEKNNTLVKNLSVKNSAGSNEEFKLIDLKNGSWAIQAMGDKISGHYLYCDGGNYSFKQIPKYWDTVTNMNLIYYPPLIITIKGNVNNKYCTDNGSAKAVMCKKDKNVLGVNDKIIMEYNNVNNTISFKGLKNNLYASISSSNNDKVFFKSTKKTSSDTNFSIYQNGTKVTYELFKIINTNVDPFIVQLKIHNKYLGIDESDDLTYVDNFDFVLTKQETSTLLQKADYGSASIWRPIPPQGYMSLGDLVYKNEYGVDNKVKKPPIFKLKKGQSLHKLNNGLGPLQVCVPINCTSSIHGPSIWKADAHVDIFTTQSEYVSQKPNKSLSLYDLSIWATGISENSHEENVNRPNIEFNPDGGYNLIRATPNNNKPNTQDSMGYTIKKSCLEYIKPKNPEIPVSDELELLKDRKPYMKCDYFSEPEFAYATRNVKNMDDYHSPDSTPKSSYIKYIKRLAPNKEQLEGTLPEFQSSVKGNAVYQILAENPIPNIVTNSAMNGFDYCLEVQGNEVKSVPCMIENKNQWWRIKDKKGENDNVLNLNNANNVPINFMSVVPIKSNNKCLNQTYSNQGENVNSLEPCDYDKDKMPWTYKSLKMADL